MAESPDTSSKDRMTIMVSSPVYGIEELLDQIYGLLSGFGYEVWMSHKGTIPVYSNMTAFETCLYAVERCDFFLAIITPEYGSGRIKKELSITHQELLKAIELKKPRWILAHDHVPFAKSLLTSLGYDTRRKRSTLQLTKTKVFEDLRIVDMYEEAIRHDMKVYRNRKGNWVQKFHFDSDVTLFAAAQFYRYDEIRKFLLENFRHPSVVRERVRRKATPWKRRKH